MHVYVIGLGHVGLPLACFAALSGSRVTGIDTDPEVVNAIKNGSINIHEFYNGVHISRLARQLIHKGLLTVSDTFTREEEAPVVFLICVGISSSDDFKQDLGPVKKVVEALLPRLRARDLVIFRTTLIPGTLDALVVPRIKALNISVYLAYCAETIAEGRAFEELEQNPLVVAGINEKSTGKAVEFFKSLSDAPVFTASTIIAAELVKVIQNIFRDVQIAFINEISEAARSLDVNIYEMINLANTHPRVDLLLPGPGVGGYCLPNALPYLKYALQGKEVSLALTETARSANGARPGKVVDFVKEKLELAGKKINGAAIGIAGLAMKDNCADYRYSPAVDIANILIEKGARVKAFDPLIEGAFSFQCSSFEGSVKNADCLLITAMQPGIQFNPALLRQLMAPGAFVVDTRNVFPDSGEIKLYRL